MQQVTRVLSMLKGHRLATGPRLVLPIHHSFKCIATMVQIFNGYLQQHRYLETHPPGIICCWHLTQLKQLQATE